MKFFDSVFAIPEFNNFNLKWKIEQICRLLCFGFGNSIELVTMISRYFFSETQEVVPYIAIYLKNALYNLKLKISKTNGIIYNLLNIVM